MSPIIKKLMFHEVIVPCHEGAINSKGMDKPLHRQPVRGKKEWGIQFDELHKLLVEVELSNGIVGIGEFYRDHNWNNIKGMAANLIGLEINNISLQSLPIGKSREYYGFECAIYDTFAKYKELRVVDLIGGPVRERVKVGAWSSHRTVKEMGEIAGKFRKMGYDNIKLKADLDDPVDQWCMAIKEAAPEMTIIFDPNMRWKNTGYAKEKIRKLEKIGNVLLLEDPLPHWMYHGFRELRSFTFLPLVLHVSPPYTEEGQSVHDAINALKLDAVDGFNFNAGIDSFKQLDSIASAAGINCWHGSEIDLGVLEAMFIHNAIAAKSCIWPSDIFGRLLRSHDLLKNPLRIEPPFAYLPEGVGLGVSLDFNAIDKFKTSEWSITL